ncbi:MAG: hypothetical protein EBZ77_17685, partial [Chitinophagia bacterium]|nr:hypothetical protein [Chitinophagia bacterium]
MVTISYDNGYCAATLRDTIYQQPDSVISGIAAQCIGNTATLTNTTPGGIWSSSNSSVATVHPTTGVLTATGSGSATITYAIGVCGATALQNVNVTPAPITASGSFCTGTTTVVDDTVLGGNWSSGTTSVATIDTDGNVYSLSSGTTIITYSIGACSDTLLANVYRNPAPIAGGSAVCQGSILSLSNSVASGTWTSSDPSVATVSATGVTTGRSGGQAYISYAIGSCTAIDTVLVTPLAVVGRISGARAICAGDAGVVANDTTDGVWTVSPGSVATIDSTGVVSGVAAGAAVVTYSLSNSCNTATDTFAVTVNPVPVPTFVTPPTTACTNSPVTYTTQSGQTGYVWTVPG